MQNFGFIESKLDGNEIIFDKKLLQGTKPIPDEYDYTKMVSCLKKPKDQGSTSKCVPYSLSYAIEAAESMKDKKLNFRLDIDRIYNARSNRTNGMQIKEALSFLKKEGYPLPNGKQHHIKVYGQLKSILAMKRSLYSNGPFVMALPVYDNAEREEFWKGEKKQGGHAICCVGYNEDGLILENTWGSGYGKNGKIIFPFDDVNKIIEAWAFLGE